MANNNNKKGQKQPPKATLDLKAKDITDKDSKAGASDKKAAGHPSSKIPKVGLKDSPLLQGKATGKPASTGSGIPQSGQSQRAKTAAPDKNKSSAGSASPSSKPVTAKKKSGGGFFSNLISATVGGVVALFGMSYAGDPGKIMQMAGLPIASGATNEIATLRQEIAALKQASSNNGLAALQQKIAALETRTAQPVSGAGASPANDKRLSELESRLQEFTKMAAGGGASAVASAAIVQKQIKKAGVADFKKQVLDLRKQNTIVQEEQAKLHESMAGLSEEQAKLHSNIAKMREDTAKLKNGAAKISSQIAQGPDLTMAMAPLLAKIKQFEGQISAVQNENKKAKSEGRNIALAIELSNLKRVFSRGLPFDMELARIKPHVPQGMDITLLERYAGKGLPNITQLGKRLNSQMDKIMSSEIETKTDSALSWKDQLLAKAKSAMKIRPTGDAKGDSTGAVLARIEYQLSKKNDLSAALEKARDLKPRPAEAAKGWIKTAQDKVAGDKLLQQIEDKLIGALGGTDN